jgi:hypothetical protein
MSHKPNSLFQVHQSQHDTLVLKYISPHDLQLLVGDHGFFLVAIGSPIESNCLNRFLALFE